MEEFEIEYFLDHINKENRDACLSMHSHFTSNYSDAKWSQYKHQAWEWGYQQHIKDILNISKRLYENVYTDFWRPNFNIEDSYEVLFLHDIEKPIKYTKNRTQEVLLLQWANTYQIREYLIKKFWIIIRPDIAWALKYIHGEWDDYTNKKRIMSELWTHCHIADNMSSWIFHNKDNPNR